MKLSYEIQRTGIEINLYRAMNCCRLNDGRTVDLDRFQAHTIGVLLINVTSWKANFCPLMLRKNTIKTGTDLSRLLVVIKHLTTSEAGSRSG